MGKRKAQTDDKHDVWTIERESAVYRCERDGYRLRIVVHAFGEKSAITWELMPGQGQGMSPVAAGTSPTVMRAKRDVVAALRRRLNSDDVLALARRKETLHARSGPPGPARR